MDIGLQFLGIYSGAEMVQVRLSLCLEWSLRRCCSCSRFRGLRGRRLDLAGPAQSALLICRLKLPRLIPLFPNFANWERIEQAALVSRVLSNSDSAADC
jgi:hypothetical protein